MPFVTFAYNTATQASTGFSPFEVLYGRKAKIPTIPDIELEQRKPYETEQWAAYLNNHLPLLHGRVLKNIEKSQVRQKRTYSVWTNCPSVSTFFSFDTVTRPILRLFD